MSDSITKPCLADYHPFKQKTYKYHGWDSESPNYCSSCNSYMKTVRLILNRLFVDGLQTVYGDQVIRLTREQALDMIELIYDSRE